MLNIGCELIIPDDFAQAASLASKVLASDVTAWEKWIDDFKAKGHLTVSRILAIVEVKLIV